MISGVFCAAATPVHADLSPNLSAFAAQCRWLISEGCDGVALLGTTGEANSFSGVERRAILEAALEAGLRPGQPMPGTGVANIPETVELTRHALSLGVTRVVMLPAVSYKGVSDEGLFQAYARVIEGVGDDRLKVVLYHIPQMSGQAAAVAPVQDRINAYRDLSNSYVQIPAIKAMIAHRTGDPGWARMRPPLVAMGAAEQADLAVKLGKIAETFNAEPA